MASLKERLSNTVEQYGKVGIGTYLVLFFGTWVGFWVALKAGLEVSSAGGTAATVGAAYLATKGAQPLRIGATLVLTPAVAWALQRMGWIELPSRTPPSTAAPSPE